jgi:DNA-binding transcriptional MerR regulator
MLTIGKVAKRTGVNASAIRYYERHGLLRPSRLENGYRVYEEDAVRRLRFLRQAQALGIALDEIRQLLEGAGEDQRPCKGVREMAYRHLDDIDLRIRRLRSLRRQFQWLLSRPASDCAGSGEGELCPLVASSAEKLHGTDHD